MDTGNGTGELIDSRVKKNYYGLWVSQRQVEACHKTGVPELEDSRVPELRSIMVAYAFGAVKLISNVILSMR